jgi:hypothetical protein
VAEPGKVPDTLYVYLVFSGVGVQRVLSEFNTLEKVWDKVLSARRSKTPMIFWAVPTGGKYGSRIMMDADMISAVRDAEEDAPLVQPNLMAQRQAQAERKADAQAVSRGGRVLMGQQAIPHGAGKKR